MEVVIRHDLVKVSVQKLTIGCLNEVLNCYLLLIKLKFLDADYHVLKLKYTNVVH